MRDLHVHTTYCDGKNTPEEMVLAAIEQGLDCIGFSAHAYMEHDHSYCIKKEDIEKYKAEIRALKEKYKDDIIVLCGVEQDIFSCESTDGYDYVIGSVHYVREGIPALCLDDTEELFAEVAEIYFGGDFYAMAEEYYKTVSQLPEKVQPDIIGHFDIITKYNEGGRYFDESHPRYVAAYKAAVDSLVECGVPFEVNTGAVSRGYKTQPYPAKPIFDYIVEKGGDFIFSGDAHSTEGLCYQFEKWEKEYITN